LFDDVTAMQKFEVWHKEHEAQLKKRSDEHRKQRQVRRFPTPNRRPQPRQEGGAE